MHECVFACVSSKELSKPCLIFELGIRPSPPTRGACVFVCLSRCFHMLRLCVQHIARVDSCASRQRQRNRQGRERESRTCKYVLKTNTAHKKTKQMQMNKHTKHNKQQQNEQTKTKTHQDKTNTRKHTTHSVVSVAHTQHTHGHRRLEIRS